MAVMFPARFPHSADPRRAAEGRVFDAFSKLDEEWLIFYSVSWQSKRRGKQGDGEADFVLVHPRKGILVAEVKGGATISIKAGKWYSVDHQGREWEIASPVQQALESKYALREWLAERVTGFNEKARLGHFIVFPAHEQREGLGPDAPRSIICDRNDLLDIAATVHRIAAHWAPLDNLSSGQVSQVRKALAPDILIRRFLRHRVEEIGSELAVLTDRQIGSLRVLRHQRRAMIVGPAGTGKTVIAAARAQQLADEGFRTLFVCLNQPLGEVLREQFRMHDLVTAGSFHAVCRGLADRAGMLPDGPVDDEWWEQALPASLPDSAWKLGIQFDAIIVDEAQDFHPDWWMYLEMLFSERTDSIMSVFADSNQDIYRVGWAPPFLTDPFPLDVNCRNTVEIASRVSAVLGSNQPTLGVHGVEPLMFEVSTPRQSEKALERILTRLINDELLDPAQIAVLSTSRDEIEKLRGAEIAGPVLGDEPGDRSVLIETVHRFKGLEANVVILLLHDGEEQDVKRLAYVGMSRARALLVLIASKGMFDVIRWA
jgi:hypothetical protein